MNRQQRRAVRAGTFLAGYSTPCSKTHTLSELVDFAKDFATANFVDAGEFQPQAYIAEDATGERKIIAAPLPNREAKQLVLAAVRKLFREIAVVRYVHLAETWIGNPALDGLPSEQSGRKEAISLFAIDRFGNRVGSIAMIERTSAGAVLKPFEDCKVTEIAELIETQILN